MITNQERGRSTIANIFSFSLTKGPDTGQREDAQHLPLTARGVLGATLVNTLTLQTSEPS